MLLTPVITAGRYKALGRRAQGGYRDVRGSAECEHRTHGGIWSSESARSAIMMWAFLKSQSY